MSTEKLISIHLNSNKAENFEKFIHSIIKNTNNIEILEVLVSIDQDDSYMKDKVNEINSNYPTLITYYETDLIKTFADAWKPLNILLLNTSETVKYITCMSDDIEFETKDWDKIILSYNNYFEDNIFRIRCSKYRNEEYVDIWECGYKPDSYAFYTKKWLDIVRMWNPCIGPDSFQECISFYMKTYGQEYNRDVINQEIVFRGQEVSSGLNFKNRINRSRIYYKAFYRLVSYRIQKIACKKSHNIVCNISKKNTKIRNISFIKYSFTNFIRRFNFFYYRGSPNHIINSKIKNIAYIAWCYMGFLDNILIKITYFLYDKKILKKIIKDEKKMKQITDVIEYERIP
tara:strand:+ start:6706 stop:7737 length:1032 start_codon:yes stop_codon:yes gene_type:complete